MWGDVGSHLRISGLLVTGGGASAVLALPGQKPAGPIEILEMDYDTWSDFIRRSDDPEILVGPSKIFHRKVRYDISGAVQQKIWKADGFKCVYCEVAMGKALLTIDHFIPLELGGKNVHTNYVTACKRCNKDKGMTHPQTWCRPGLFNALEIYLTKRIVN
jgi:hypothetical protein